VVFTAADSCAASASILPFITIRAGSALPKSVITGEKFRLSSMFPGCSVVHQCSSWKHYRKAWASALKSQ
jgi:hypothetical protein